MSALLLKGIYAELALGTSLAVAMSWLFGRRPSQGSRIFFFGSSSGGVAGPATPASPSASST